MSRKNAGKYIRKVILAYIIVRILFPFSVDARQLDDTISTVNGEKISVSKFVEGCRLERWYMAEIIRFSHENEGYNSTQLEAIYYPLFSLLSNPDTQGAELLETLEQEIILQQAADTYHIAVDQNIMDQLVKQDMEFFPSAISATDFYRLVAQAAGVSQATVHEFYYYKALERQLFEEVTASVPATERQVRTQYILLAFNPQNPFDITSVSSIFPALDALKRAYEAIERLYSGEVFSSVASTMSDDPSVTQNEGLLPWSGPESLLPYFWEIVHEAPIGEIIGPIRLEVGYIVVQVLAREERSISDNILIQKKQEFYSKWLSVQISHAVIERTPNWEDFVPLTPTRGDLLGDLQLDLQGF